MEPKTAQPTSSPTAPKTPPPTPCGDQTWIFDEDRCVRGSGSSDITFGTKEDCCSDRSDCNYFDICTKVSGVLNPVVSTLCFLLALSLFIFSSSAFISRLMLYTFE